MFIGIRYFWLPVLCYATSLKIWHIFVSVYFVIKAQHTFDIFSSTDCEFALVYASVLVTRPVLVTRRIYWSFSWQGLVKGLRFCITCRLRSLLLTTSWLLVENMTHLGQRQRTLLLKGIGEAGVSVLT